jgi:lysophospholipase L1-like esterase
MNFNLLSVRSAVVLLMLSSGAALFPNLAEAQSAPGAGMHWVATWATAHQQPRSFRSGRGGGRNGGPAPNAPVGTADPSGRGGGAGRMPPPPGNLQSFNNQTVRMVVRVSLGGSRVRVRLANTYGATPLVIGAAHAALHLQDSAILPGSDRALSFGGKGTVTIPPGAEVLSDPISLTLPALGELVLSVYVPSETGPASDHFSSFRTTWISKEGDLTSAAEFTDASTLEGWFWIAGVDVEAPATAGTIVAFGDSITDGATSTVNADRSWPNELARRLQANRATARVAVVNEGIGGNRILSDEFGVNALARFDRDVLAQPGVKWLILLEGINDLNFPPRSGPQIYKQASAEDLIVAMKQMVERAHTHGIKVIGGTLTPFGRATEYVEAQRQILNEFIRNGKVFDGVADFDKAARDPKDPMQFREGYNNTDRLHPNDAGLKAMAEAIDLSLFVSAPSRSGTVRRR